MTARHHHYLSQCYLKGFTKGNAKKSKLTVIDLKERKTFETIPRNVGGIRDFNRIDIEGVDPNLLESDLSSFESDAATALKTLRKTLYFSDEVRELILNLVALLAIRSPERREHMRQFHEQIAERVMGLILHSKDRWESQMAKLKEDDPTYNRSVTYEQAKEFFESKQYTMQVAREHHIHMEMNLIDAILPYLVDRNWRLLVAGENTGPFITTDRPVSLTWKDPENIPPFYRSSPGYGLMGTQVYFPVSQELALVGEFDGSEGVHGASEELVAVMNSTMLFNMNKQVYSPKLDFKFYGKDNQILSGKRLLKEITGNS